MLVCTRTFFGNVAIYPLDVTLLWNSRFMALFFINSHYDKEETDNSGRQR